MTHTVKLLQIIETPGLKAGLAWTPSETNHHRLTICKVCKHVQCNSATRPVWPSKLVILGPYAAMRTHL